MKNNFVPSKPVKRIYFRPHDLIMFKSIQFGDTTSRTIEGIDNVFQTRPAEVSINLYLANGKDAELSFALTRAEEDSLREFLAPIIRRARRDLSLDETAVV